MNKKALTLLSLGALLTLSGCNFVVQFGSSSSTSQINSESGHADGTIITPNATLTQRTFSKDTLKEGSIIPSSYTSSGVNLELDDMKIFANAITYEALHSDKIWLRKNNGFIRNSNPIKNLSEISFTNMAGNLSLYVTDGYYNTVWQKIEPQNGFKLSKSYNYFALVNTTKYDVSFDAINFKYTNCDQQINNNTYNIKNIDEVTKKEEADSLITISNEPFTNDEKWTSLGYASNINESINKTNARKQSGYDKYADWQLPYNPNIVVNSNLNAYRIVNMQYGDGGNSFRINMLDGTPGPVIYKDAAYTYIEDIAAYVLAFGDMPINTKYDKDDKSSAVNDWGKIGRVNYNYYHNRPSGSFEFETKLITHREYFDPLQNDNNYWYRYYESDYGADIGNDEPAQIGAGYSDRPYNNGSIGQRGALRFVWTQSYADMAHSGKEREKIVESYNRNLFYTATHYNDFQQYLNYYGGWSIRFGNTTLGNNWDQYVAYNHFKDSPKVLLTSLEKINK